MDGEMERSAAYEDGRRGIPARIGAQRDLTVEHFCRLLVTGHVSTWRHSRRVRAGARLIAQTLGLSAQSVAVVEQAALLHDIGKLVLDGVDLDKPGRFTDAETYLVRRHPELGRNLIACFPCLELLVPAVLHHHERWDGRGYPHQLAGEEIPWMARLVAVADSYDAMTSIRPYRSSLTHDEAVREILFHSGTQFDPVMVRAFATGLQRRA